MKGNERVTGSVACAELVTSFRYINDLIFSVMQWEILP